MQRPTRVQQPIRVVVVDDSALMRLMVSRLLGEMGKFEVVATAVDGAEGVEKVCALKPDAVTMDVEMPRMDGLTAVKKIMHQCPTPVIMLSTLTTAGASITMRALAAGAVDFVPKPLKPQQVKNVAGKLAAKILTAVRSSSVQKIKRMAALPPSPPPIRPSGITNLTRPAPAGRVKLVVVGSSTGGPAALQAVLPVLPANFPAAVVVVQHLPKGFSKPMADHLARKCRMEVRHAENSDRVLPGKIYIAPAGYDLDFKATGNNVAVKLDPGLDRPLKPGGFRPSVDWVMDSALRTYGRQVMGVLLTGMGRDGARGMVSLNKNGSYTIAQDETTCVVYGMPRAAIESGGASVILPLNKISSEIMNKTRL